MWWSNRDYVSVAERRAQAESRLKQLAKEKGQVAPVKIAGRQIAATFWGQAWCDNLEAYSDFSSRLPRGRTYVRNGSVIDLQIQLGYVTALVSGSEIYEIRVELAPLAKPIWKQVKSQCAGRIGSLVDLLQGKLSQDVMSIVTAREGGLFPTPDEITMQCSCPDFAYLCKHLAAVLYGIGARLDQQPELLFRLRQVDHLELITAAGDRAAATPAPTKKPAIAAEALAEIFGIELETATSQPAQTASKKPRAAKSARRSQRPAGTSARGSRTKKAAGKAPVAKKPQPKKPKKRQPQEKLTSSAQKKPKARARTKTAGRPKT